MKRARTAEMENEQQIETTIRSSVSGELCVRAFLQINQDCLVQMFAFLGLFLEEQSNKCNETVFITAIWSHFYVTFCLVR